VPAEEEKYTREVLIDKAEQVRKVIRDNVKDVEDEIPQELWKMLQFSLQHRITYMLRVCTPEETTEITTLVDEFILEAATSATKIDFNQDEAVGERLRLPARMKAGGIKRMEDVKYPAFQGTLSGIYQGVSTEGQKMERLQEVTMRSNLRRR
jgi:hypothetical protein